MPGELGCIDLTRIANGGGRLYTFVLANCSFTIGTRSGPSWTAALFKKPVLMIIMTSIGRALFTICRDSIYVPKLNSEADEKWSLSRILRSRHAHSKTSIEDLARE
jgi:ADP-heptose:LPS heptosyltransferase